MITFDGKDANTVWFQALSYLRNENQIQESRDQETLELLHVAFTIRDPRQRIVFSRPINPAFAIAEVIWILAGANDSQFLSFWNPRMLKFTDVAKGKFHGAYGYRLGSQPKILSSLVNQLRHSSKGEAKRLDQLRAAYNALSNTPHSRQIVLQIWQSDMDLPNPAPRSKDIPCNIVSHLMIRHGKLEWLQFMRSNDLIWGTPYNFIQFSTLQEVIAGWLGVDVGSYNHISDSLHIYERHWEHIAHFEQVTSIPQNSTDLRIGPYELWEKEFESIVSATYELTKISTLNAIIAIKNTCKNSHPAYREWIALLVAECLRRRGFLSEAREIIDEAGLFWATSWKNWENTQLNSGN